MLTTSFPIPSLSFQNSLLTSTSPGRAHWEEVQWGKEESIDDISNGDIRSMLSHIVATVSTSHVHPTPSLRDCRCFRYDITSSRRETVVGRRVEIVFSPWHLHIAYITRKDVDSDDDDGEESIDDDVDAKDLMPVVIDGLSISL